MALWPKLPFCPEETLLSYADRLSVLHTRRGIERLLKDQGVNREHFTSGREEAVAAFADAVGLPVKDLLSSSIRVLQRGARFRGETTTKSFLSPRVTRYCPTCLAEDGPHSDRKFRLIWGFRHVVRCDQHSVWLADAPISNEISMRRALGDAQLAAPSAAFSEIPTYLRWLRTRLGSLADPSVTWMSSQTFEQVLAASEMLGGILQHGHRVALTRLSPAEAEEATDIGFSIYADGPEAIEEALDTIRQTSPATAVQAGPLAYYGKLFDWLDRRSNGIDPGPIRDILRDHIVKHSAVEPFTKVLGVEITERRYHSLYSLSTAVGIERPRLSRLLKKLGEIPVEATEVESGKMVFAAKKTVGLIDAFSTAISLQDVPDYLGASRRQVEMLYRTGIVRPLVPRGSRGSVRQVVFAKDHLDHLLERLAEVPVIDETGQGDFHPIAYVCQRGAGQFVNIFTGILDGRIGAFRRNEKVGIGSIMLDANAVVAIKNSA